jgi:hypothetical protein
VTPQREAPISTTSSAPLTLPGAARGRTSMPCLATAAVSAWVHGVAAADPPSGPGTGPVSGQLSETAGDGAGPLSRFPVALRRTGVGFSGVLFPPRAWAVVTSGLPVLHFQILRSWVDRAVTGQVQRVWLRL